MDEIDAQIEAARAELAALRAEPEPSVGRQFAFDVPAGIATAGAGLVDVLSLPFTAAARGLGADPETTRYFALTKELQNAKEALAAKAGVEADTGTQELISFLTPSPLSKAKLLSQAGTGLASYLGMQGAEAIAPESEYAGLVGALAGPGLATGAGRLAGAAAPALEEAGKGLQRASLNVRKTDLTSAKNAILQSEEALGLPKASAEKLSTTQVTKSLNNLIDENVLGKSRNPTVVYDTAINAKEAIEEQIQSALKAVDSSDVKVAMPKFANASKFLKDNRVDITDIDSYENIIKEFQKAVKNESAFVAPTLPTLYDEFGNVVAAAESPTMQKALKVWEKEQIGRSKLSLDVLNKQRKVFGEKYKQGPQSNRQFWRAFYKDIKEHIEQYAPEVKELNRRKQDLIVAEPILSQAKKASEKPFTASDLRRAALYTTGGGGLVGATYLTGGNPLLGALISGGLALAGTGRGQDVIGRGLRGTASLAEALGKPPTRTTQTSQLISQKAFEEAQPYIHGTTEEGLQAITEAGNFIPKTIRYSVLGPGAIYGAPKGSMWLDPERAAKARMWDLPKQVPIYLEPKAKIAQINNDNDWANLAKKVGMKPDELSKALWYDPTEYNAKQQLEVAEQVKKKLIEVGVDAIEMNTTPYNKTLKQIQDKYGEWWNKKLRKEDQQDWEYMATAPSEAIQRLRSRFSIYDAMGGEQQIAILDPKIAQPADKAYERLLKESPEQLRQITPDELAIISNSTKDKLLQSGYLSSKTVRDFEQLTKTTTEAPDDIDAAIEAARQELEALRSSTPQPETVKVGKQNVSIPTGKEYAPPSLVKAVIQVESAGKPEAVSSKGAAGLMQIMPATAKQLGIEDRFDPEQNVEGGSRYLQQMLDKYGKTDIALAAYNWGPGNIDKAIRQVKADGKRVTWANIMQAVKVPQETRLYVNKVLSREQEA